MGNQLTPTPRATPRAMATATLAAAAALAGCAGTRETIPYRNIVMVDQRGDLLDPRTRSMILPELLGGIPAVQDVAEFTSRVKDASDGSAGRAAEEEYFDDVIEAMRKHAPAGEKHRVLLFFHGGLNSMSTSIDRAERLAAEISQTSGAPYPVFVNWKSSAWSSLFEHWFVVRQGDDQWRSGAVSGSIAFATAPFSIAADALRGVGRAAPAAIQGALAVPGELCSTDANDAHARADAMLLENPTPKPLIEHDQRFIHPHGTLTAWVQAPLVAVTSVPAAPILDGFGTSAFDNMVRRTTMAFDRERDYEHDDHDAELDAQGSGALSRFLERLETETKTGDWEITLVGHSMGTILVNTLLHRYPDLPVTDVVYMAAACSLRDYHESVIPWMQLPGHAHARMHHVVLHDQCEVGEQVGGWLGFLVPRGSLLTWLDRYLMRPGSLLDRRCGIFVNLMSAEHLTPDDPSLRGRITIRQFSADDPEHNPQQHGEFDEFPFWDPTFWTPGRTKPARLGAAR